MSPPYKKGFFIRRNIAESQKQSNIIYG